MLGLRGGKIIGKEVMRMVRPIGKVYTCVQMYIYTYWGGGGEASIIYNFTLLP